MATSNVSAEQVKVRPRVQVFFPKQTITKQSFRDECNINTIMAKYERTGLLSHVRQHQGQYGDFSELQDYQSSLNQVIAAQEMFMSLPAKLRAKFDNDPGQFLSFVDNPDNLDQMRDLGLLKEQEAPSTSVVEDVRTFENTAE